MNIGIPCETLPNEERVALIPQIAAQLVKMGHGIQVQAGAGYAAGYPDEEYQERGATIIKERKGLFKEAEIVFQVNGLGLNPTKGKADLKLMKQGQIVIAMLDPLWACESMETYAQQGVTTFALELIPRITRAQSMDILSSMATVAGYKAVLLGANQLDKMFPMLMTAAGSLAPAKVLVIGAGVAGLQAIATAKRLGAVVSGYDIRPVVREQVESLGAKFVELDLRTEGSEDEGGYAKAQDEAFYTRQRELMGDVIAEHDLVISTAAIPGRKSPVLITKEMVQKMRPGSVIVDIAAERGGNCELTRLDETVEVNGITILGPGNLASSIPYHASQMYAKNIATFFKNLFNKEGEFDLNLDDEVIAETLITRDGKIVNKRVQEALEARTGN